jgi:tight adherence protein C
MVVTPIILAVLVFLSVLSLGHVAVQFQQHQQTKNSIDVVLTRYAEVEPSGVQVSSDNWGVWGAWLASLAERILSEASLVRLRHQLDVAGQPEVSALTKALRNKILFAATFGFVVSMFAWTTGGWLWIIVPLAVVLGFLVPDLLIYNQALRRTDEIAENLPDSIELLNLCVEAGMSFQSALAYVAKSHSGPVSEEFARVLREMQLGQSRQDALLSLSARTKQEDLLHLINAIVQADGLGVAISGVLREQAKEMRSKRRDRAREAAQKVPVKILLPVILCFLPGIFIIVLGPAVISMAKLFGSLT